MTDETVQHELGVLTGTINSLSESITIWRKEQRGDIEKIFNKIDKMPETCATGKHHEETIRELQKRPERIVSIIFAIVTIICTITTVYLTTKGMH